MDIKERVRILKEITGELKENNWLGFTSDDAKEKILISVFLDYIRDAKFEQELAKASLATEKQKNFMASLGVVFSDKTTKEEANKLINEALKSGQEPETEAYGKG